MTTQLTQAEPFKIERTGESPKTFPSFAPPIDMQASASKSALCVDISRIPMAAVIGPPLSAPLPPLHMRFAAPEDYPEIEQMYRLANEQNRKTLGFDQWKAPSFRKLKESVEAGTLHVWFSPDGKPVASFSIDETFDDGFLKGNWKGENPCCIHRFCVSVEHQRKGVASSLIPAIDELLNGEIRGKRYDSVRIDIHKDNKSSIRFAQKLGFSGTDKGGYLSPLGNEYLFFEKTIQREKTRAA